MPRLNSPGDLEDLRKSILSKKDSSRPCISICGGAACCAQNDGVVGAFDAEIRRLSLDKRVDIRATGCLGLCEKGPLVVIHPEEIFYVGVRPGDAQEIVSETILNKKVIDRLLYTDPDSGEKSIHQYEVPFYRDQTRFLIGANAKVDPRSIDDYLAIGGYAALSKSLFEMGPDRVLEEIKKANLRGRGGAGFPAGSKWETARNAPGEVKYVIVNGHEGEPGAFMDRAILAGNPHSVLEGLIIGAYTIGAHQGYIYTRHDAPRLLDNLAAALAQAESYGILGENILGSGFDFNVEVHFDLGIFVSGESSALMRSIEGRTPEPRSKYIRTSISGVRDRPTNLNNVETWANVPLIIDKGSEWYAGIGTERSKGMKLISVSGNVVNAGVVEVPMGTSLKKIVYDMCGGVPNGKKLKALHFGGSMGGSLPEGLIDTPLDFDALAKLGAPMGAGALLVIDEDTCMVDMARFFLTYLSGESCGKCVPCREGQRQMLRILDNLCKGKGKEGDVELLEAIAETTKTASLCALGKSATDPLLSTLRYFRDEYEAHIRDRRCPARSCRGLASCA